MAIAGVATELLGLTPWHMSAPMHAHARACRSSSAPARPLPLHAHARATPCRSCPPLPSCSPQPPHHYASRDTHPGRAPHSRWLRSPHLLPPIPSLAPLSRPCLAPPPVVAIFCRPPLSHAGRISALHRRPLASLAACCFLLLCAALPLVRCCAMPSTPPWTNVAEGLLMEYEKEVTEKLWRGRRSGAVSPGCGGGVYARRSRSGRRGHNWKESQKKNS